MTGIEVPLTRGYVALIDQADADRVLSFKWAAMPRDRTVYAYRGVRRGDGSRTSIALHTYLTGFATTDHINGDGLDNRRCNLREATTAENKRNMRLPRNNTSGYKGVSRIRATGQWLAGIGFDGRSIHLGRHATPEAAALAYDAAARELHGSYATLNFPTPTERAA